MVGHIKMILHSIHYVMKNLLEEVQLGPSSNKTFYPPSHMYEYQIRYETHFLKRSDAISSLF